MKPNFVRSRYSEKLIRCCVAITCAALVLPANLGSFARPVVGSVAQDAVKIPPEQLESLVAPIALYPDSMLSQTLVASTYPLEIIQLQQWLEKNKNLKDKALVDAVKKQPWDPFQHIGILSLEFHVDKLSRPLL